MFSRLYFRTATNENMSVFGPFCGGRGLIGMQTPPVSVASVILAGKTADNWRVQVTELRDLVVELYLDKTAPFFITHWLIFSLVELNIWKTNM